MRAFRSIIATRKVLLALYVLAVTAIGFAHKPAVASKSLDAAFFTLPDGTLSFLCITAGIGGHSGTHAASPCEACLLAGAPGLPAPAGLNVCAPMLVRTLVPQNSTRVVRCRGVHAQARAPPGFSNI
ncbi:hypothetical protein C6Y62_15945 [Hyphomicrobium sulfonivorans]|nr:hypothetical protein [Hyphomicrobium sulfonivorans]